MMSSLIGSAFILMLFAASIFAIGNSLSVTFLNKSEIKERVEFCAKVKKKSEIVYGQSFKVIGVRCVN